MGAVHHPWLTGTPDFPRGRYISVSLLPARVKVHHTNDTVVAATLDRVSHRLATTVVELHFFGNQD